MTCIETMPLLLRPSFLVNHLKNLINRKQLLVGWGVHHDWEVFRFLGIEHLNLEDEVESE